MARVGSWMLVGMLGWTTTVGADATFPDDAAIDAMLEARVATGRVKGIVVGLVDESGDRRIRSFGESGAGALPLGADTIFEIGSITKAFTGIALARMAIAGDLSLDDPLTRHVPADIAIPHRSSGSAMRLADLATHRSGLPRLPSNFAPADFKNPYADYTVEHLYAFLAGYELDRDVDSAYEYSNLGAGLLGHVLA